MTDDHADISALRSIDRNASASHVLRLFARLANESQSRGADYQRGLAPSGIITMTITIRRTMCEWRDDGIMASRGTGEERGSLFGRKNHSVATVPLDITDASIARQCEYAISEN
jgi:hypothetical protein